VLPLPEGFHTELCDEDLQFAVKHGLEAFRDMPLRIDSVLRHIYQLYDVCIRRVEYGNRASY
jgi:hypothetical protein